MTKTSLSQVSSAVKVWTDWQTGIMPKRDDELYSSQARFVAVDLAEMGRLAIEDFKDKHPELPSEVAEAFAWCYTFDYK